jgi:hypothetical protein
MSVACRNSSSIEPRDGGVSGSHQQTGAAAAQPGAPAGAGRRLEPDPILDAVVFVELTEPGAPTSRLEHPAAVTRVDPHIAQRPQRGAVEGYQR